MHRAGSAGPSAAPRVPLPGRAKWLPACVRASSLGGLTPPSRYPITSPRCPPAHLSNPEFSFETDTQSLLKKPKDLAWRASCPGVAGAHVVTAASPPCSFHAQVLPTHVAPLFHFLTLPGPTGIGVGGFSSGPCLKSLHSVWCLHPQSRRSGGQRGDKCSNKNLALEAEKSGFTGTSSIQVT